ncbi:hypothetical protein M2322_000659 [Rhodoblastus acidophilus]|uniref:hypothetical protein n=1 Tax=Rhodoblastus acidophilus TaxID=1074 RepID=UPI0022258208|nr:hypothetical protein [Rhodoblastus acidophilus]MCW2315125.1 hypothetical protein [Rhodoblastus acidophilus]
MIPDLPLRTPFDRSVHVRHVGVNGPWLSGTWAISIEPMGHPTIRDALLVRLTPEQVRALIGGFLYIDPSLGAHVRRCEEDRAGLVQCVLGETSNSSQSSSAAGTPSVAADDAGKSVSPACSACSKEAG